MCLEVCMLFNEVCTNIHMTLLWKFWTLEEYCCLIKIVCSLLVHSTKSESCLYRDSKCCSCQLISWVRILKRLLETAGSFISGKLRISLKCVSVKIMILWNGKSLQIWDEEKQGKSLLAMCSWAEACPSWYDLCFQMFAGNTGRQKVCCYCLCRIVTDAVDLLK